MTDAEAWAANPRHRWVYSKLAVAETQGIACAPLGVEPPSYPVIVRPITNLHGMALGARVVREGPIPYEPGLFWSEILRGPHWSIDFGIMLETGRSLWQAARGIIREDTLEPLAWIQEPSVPREIERAARDWLFDHLTGYDGPLNVELIGDKVIEVHLRHSTDFSAVPAGERAIGIPLRGPVNVEGLPAWVQPSGEDESPVRTGFLVVRAAGNV